MSSWTSRSNLNSIPIGEPVVTLASRLPSLPPECASHCDSCFTFLLWMYPRCHPPPPSSIPIPDYGQLVLPLQFKVSLAYTRTGALHDSPNSGVCSKVTRLTTYHLTKGLWEKKLIKPRFGVGKNPQQPLSSKLINLSTIFRKNVS